MTTYAIPLYLYVEADSPAAAMALKKKTEELLANPIVASVMKSANIPQRGWVVQDPVVAPQR